MRPIRIMTPIVGLGLLAASLTVPSVQAAPPDAAPAASLLGFTPTLTYVRCPADEDLPPRTRCATLTVPLDWQTPDDGRTTQIALRVKRSKERGGALTFNPGGPGESGIAITSAIYSMLPAQVRDRFDFVTWDSRGVGLSGPPLINCPNLSAAFPNATGPVDWDSYWEDVLRKNSESNMACLAASPDAAPYLGTWQVIRDMEAMRIALGYDKWNYWGMSYGTRIGHAYARTFPNSLRALIMDGSLMAGETLLRFGTTYPAGLEVSQQVYASVTYKSQAHKIDAIFEYLDDSIIPTQNVDITRWLFAANVRALLTKQATYPNLYAFVETLYGVVKASTSATRSRALRAVDDMWQHLPRVTVQEGALTLTNCADLHDRPTAAQIADASRTAARQYGTGSVMWMFNASLCAGLPADMSPALPTGTSVISLANPPMFVLSTGDAATPWVWGRSMANSFARSRTISYASTQHVTYLQTPSTCVNDPVTRYLLTLKPPRGDISCPFTPSR